MRTTVRLDDSLFAENGTTLTAVIENALRQFFAGRKVAVRCGKVKFTTSGRGGLRPGLDLDDSAALAELMERPHDPD